MGEAAPKLDGPLRPWALHDLTVIGPFRSENPETFRDFRLVARFENARSGERVDVCGFFAGDGAAGSGARAGKIWRVTFAPPSSGLWTYRIGFRAAPDLAVSPIDAAGFDFGEPISEADGVEGRFTILEEDRSAPQDTVRDLQKAGPIDVSGGDLVFRATASRTTLRWSRSALDLLGAEDAPSIAEAVAREGVTGAALATALVASGAGVEGGRLGAPVVSPWARWPMATSFGDALPRACRAFNLARLDAWRRALEHLHRSGVATYLSLDLVGDETARAAWAAPSLQLERRLHIREMAARFGALNGVVWIAPRSHDDRAFLERVDGHGRAIAEISKIVAIGGAPKLLIGEDKPQTEEDPESASRFWSIASTVKNIRIGGLGSGAEKAPSISAPAVEKAPESLPPPPAPQPQPEPAAPPLAKAPPPAAPAPGPAAAPVEEPSEPDRRRRRFWAQAVTAISPSETYAAPTAPTPADIASVSGVADLSLTLYLVPRESGGAPAAAARIDLDEGLRPEQLSSADFELAARISGSDLGQVGALRLLVSAPDGGAPAIDESRKFDGVAVWDGLGPRLRALTTGPFAPRSIWRVSVEACASGSYATPLKTWRFAMGSEAAAEAADEAETPGSDAFSQAPLGLSTLDLVDSDTDRVLIALDEAAPLDRKALAGRMLSLRAVLRGPAAVRVRRVEAAVHSVHGDEERVVYSSKDFPFATEDEVIAAFFAPRLPTGAGVVRLTVYDSDDPSDAPLLTERIRFRTL